MNLIFLDYDISDHNQIEKIQELYEKKENCKVYSLSNNLAVDIRTDEPARGVVITALRSGWMKYHSEFAKQYPFVTHWIFCVIGMSGNALKETVANQFAGNISAETYCELVFDDTSFSVLNEKLRTPIKCKKKCLVVSLNAKLAEEVTNILRVCIPEWDVVYSAERTPDYDLCDSVFFVGNTPEEMAVARPEIRSTQICFWINKPYFTSQSDMAAETVLLGKRMNEAGWNIGDYFPITFFSSLHHEQVYQQICKEEMTPTALLSDPLFVLWDDYGLPQVQSILEDETLLSFLASHTVLKIMTDLFCSKNGGKNR